MKLKIFSIASNYGDAWGKEAYKVQHTTKEMNTVVCHKKINANALYFI